MLITRKRLNLNSLAYSREFDIDRSAGVHLMSVVDWIGQTSHVEKKHSGSLDLEPYASAGFLWEHVMSRADKLSHALSVEAMRMYMFHRPYLTFPGEQFWCKQCDRCMPGGKRARIHCRRRGHRGIFFTPDAFDTRHRRYVEWKFTWKSSARSHPSALDSSQGIWRWPVQCMFNCMGLGTRRAKLIALHCNGDYKYRNGPPQPQAYSIYMTFTKREIQRTKDMIVGNAENEGWI